MSQDVQRDFFISYTSADSRWAEWIAWQLEEAGYTVVLQAWDFRPGANFVSEMERAIATAKRTIAVLSTQYLNALYTQPEWAAAFRRDPQGEQGILVPVRIHECEVTGLLGQVIYIDLAGRDEDAGRKTLLAGVRSQRAKPELAPAFPDKIQHTVSRQLNFPGDLPPIWNVPYPRNSLFVGREQTLQDLHTTLSTQHRAALAQLSTGSGPGNIGARETAVEYTYRYQSDYHIILWVNASSRQTLTSDFMSIVSLLNLPEKSSQEQDRIVSAVKRWLETHAYWLLVLDDAQDAALIKEFIPSSNRGHLLLTTRTRSMETLAPLIEMDSMKPEEQTLLLQLSRTVGATLRSSQRQLPLGLEQIAIGRTPDNQVVLSDPSVSSHHAKIHLKEQRYWITDLGSTNGTYVNSQRLDPQVPCLLDPGNIIRIGNTTFTYEVNGTPESKLPAIPSPAPAHTRLEQNVPATPASKANVGEHVGQRFGNYQLVRLLGQGGFGEIYLGEHVYLDTQAAIKVLHTKLANEDIENFRQEARTIARLIHPHIVRVLDFGMEGTTPFLVMDYAPRDTLRRLYPQGTRLPIETVVSYVKQMASALQYAHDRKVVHRDVKPENMLVGHSDEVLLSDFGIALIAQSSRYQNPLDMAGTIAYMAPEQIEAHPRPASDQYSLGIVVYEWLTGDRPFHGSFKEIAIKHSLVPPPSLCEQVPALPPAVEQVVLIALAKDPKQRFATVQAFANALEQSSLVEEPLNMASPLGLSQPPVQGTTPLEPRPIQPGIDASSLFPSPNNVVVPSSSLSLIGPSLSYSATSVLSQPTSVTPRRGFSRSKIVFVIVLALLVVMGSSGFFYFKYYNIFQRNSLLRVAIANPYPPSAGTLALNDPLSDNSNGYFWGESSDVHGNCGFTEGAYHVSALTPKINNGRYCSTSTISFSNFAYQVHMTIVQGDYGGIGFRGDVSNHYFFSINDNGMYILSIFKDNNIFKVIANGFSSEMNKAQHQSNLLAVVVNGSIIDLYINKHKIDRVIDNTYNQGEIGVGAATYGNSTEVAFSNANVWVL